MYPASINARCCFENSNKGFSLWRQNHKSTSQIPTVDLRIQLPWDKYLRPFHSANDKDSTNRRSLLQNEEHRLETIPVEKWILLHCLLQDDDRKRANRLVIHLPPKVRIHPRACLDGS